MAFRGLTTGGKMVFIGVGAATVAGVLNFYHIPYYTDMYKVHFKVNEIPRFKREMLVDEWKKLQARDDGDQTSLLKKTLTEQMLYDLRNYKTQRHGNLLLVMQEAIRYGKGEIGANAPDKDCYDLFRPLFDPIIAHLHNGFGQKKGAPKKHPKSYWGDEQKWAYFDDIKNLDNEGRFIKNIRFECYRSLKYFTYQPLMSESDYFQYEYWINRIFNETPGFVGVETQTGVKEKPELAGKLYFFRKLNNEEKKEWDNSTFSFKNNDERLEACGFYQFWPAARALFVNDSKNFAVQVANEEHLKFISIGTIADFKPCLKRLVEGIKVIESVTPYTWHDRLGFVNSSPRNLGTGLNVIFDLHLPNLSKKADFKEICDSLHLKLNKKGDLVTVTNSYQLGMNEYDTTKLVYDGVKRLVEMEKSS